MSDWPSYERMVIDKLDGLAVDVRRLEDKVESLMIDVAMLKVKAGVWGATAGLIPASVAVILTLLGGTSHG